jgi:hypothetical protein
MRQERALEIEAPARAVVFRGAVQHEPSPRVVEGKALPPDQAAEVHDRERPVDEKDRDAAARVPERPVGPRVHRPDRRDRPGDDDSERDLQENRSRTQPARRRDRHRVGDRPVLFRRARYLPRG